MMLRSYAKINLTLDILGKRRDGFHNIKTIFQQVNLFDDIYLEHIDKKDGIELKCNVKSLENNENLCFKAAQILWQEHGIKSIKKGILIKLNKRIPIGSGLGGGSSNAATVLKGLNVFWNLGLSQEDLVKISGKLGMDVAFHIVGGTCLGTKRGEEIEKIRDLNKHYIIIVYPEFQISSEDMYGSLSYKEIGKKYSTDAFLKDYDLNYLHNDFDTLAVEKYPILNEIKKQLGGRHALLSGSGSCIYGIYNSQKDAVNIYQKIKSRYKTTFLTETMNKKIIMAKEMGFCSGVKKAINMTANVNDKSGVTVLGQLIHNDQEMERLTKLGIKSSNDYDSIKQGTAIISAHGASDEVIKKLKEKKLTLLDATCPLVKRLYDIAKLEESRRRKVIIFGDKEHSEIKGVVGNLKNYKVISDISDLSCEDFKEKLSLISQTTKEASKFDSLAKNLKEKCEKKHLDLKVIDTICNATKERQKSAAEVAQSVNLMLVIGSKLSANTLRLKEVCARFCMTKHIETEQEIKSEWLHDKETVGITAGASTPNWIIENVKNRLKMLL